MAYKTYHGFPNSRRRSNAAAIRFWRSTLCATLLWIGAAVAGGEPWIAHPEVIDGDGVSETITGHVFEDLNRDGRRQRGEPGIPGVLVSNGLDVIATDTDGAYALPVLPDMNLTVIQPSGWRVPTDERLVPQFFYVHKPGGTPEELRFGGLPDTGPAPGEVRFPLVRAEGGVRFRAAVIGDSQAYSNTEVGYFRDAAIADLLSLDSEEEPDLLLYVGDVAGDDLDLIDRILEVGATVGAPQWLVHGNHDLDFDATSDAHSSDSWRHIYGPQYYAFEVGDALFVVLDNVVYPCGTDDTVLPGREFCDERVTYNGRVPTQQMTWLANLMQQASPDRRVVLSHHIPFVSFVDSVSRQHQTDNLPEIYQLVAGRPALSLSGHTHTIENLAPGECFEEWQEAVGVGELPFRHIIAGAASGGWYTGDFNYRGTPMSLQRMGAPSGVLLLDFEGADFSERYLSSYGKERGMWVGVNTPAFRSWFETLEKWQESRPSADELPPLSINDLQDTRLITPGDLREGVYLTANVWAGSRETRVHATLNGRRLELERTQEGAGESPRIGAEWADSFAAQRQLAVARVAFASASGDERAQGVEVFKGSQYGPASPRPGGILADRNMHLWRARLPAALEPGIYRVEVTSVDRHARVTTERLVIEVRQNLPPPRWRREIW